MKYLLLLSAILLMASSVAAQEVPKMEVFGGYSYLREDLGGAHPGLNGFDASFTYNINHFLGVKADISGHFNGKTTINIPTVDFGGLILNRSADIRSSNLLFLFGPQLTYRKMGRLVPFGHVLLGGVRRKVSFPAEVQTIGNTTITTIIKGADTGFGIAFGGGLDIKVAKGVGFRLAQADYVLGNIAGDRQNIMRISTGLVLQFGK